MFVFVILVVRTLGSGYAASCESPSLPLGHVDGSGDSSSWTGSVSCLPGYTLVGNIGLKCRAGQWSADIPVCTKLDGCDPGDLPDVEHGRKYAYQSSRYRGGVYKYSCYKGYQRIGVSLVWCEGGRWSGGGHRTVCAKSGCDQKMVSYIHNGHATKEADGAVFTFSCKEGGVLDGPGMVYCDGHRWNGSSPQCLTGPSSVIISGPSHILPGESAMLDCASSISNPPALLHWTVQDGRGREVDTHALVSDTSTIWSGTGWVTSSTIQLYYVTHLSLIHLQCTATNTALQHKVKDMLVVAMHSPPTTVTISAQPNQATAGETVQVQCVSSPSLPPAHLHWVVMQDTMRVEHTPVEEVEQLEDGSWRTRSVLEFVAGDGDEVVVECLAKHDVLEDDTVAYVHVIKIEQTKKKTVNKAQTITKDMLEIRLKDDENEKEEANSNLIHANKEDANVEKVIESDHVNVEGSADTQGLDVSNYSALSNTEEPDENLVSDDYDNVNDEASAMKDSKSINYSTNNISSYICIIICYLFSKYYI